MHITPLPAYTSIVTSQFLPVPEVSEPEHLFLDSARQSLFGHSVSSSSSSSSVDNKHNQQINKVQQQRWIRVAFVLVHITPLPAYTSVVTLQILPAPEGSEPEHLFLDSARQSMFGHSGSGSSSSSSVENEHDQQRTHMDLNENTRQP